MICINHLGLTEFPISILVSPRSLMSNLLVDTEIRIFFVGCIRIEGDSTNKNNLNNISNNNNTNNNNNNNAINDVTLPNNAMQISASSPGVRNHLEKLIHTVAGGNNHLLLIP